MEVVEVCASLDGSVLGWIDGGDRGGGGEDGDQKNFGVMHGEKDVKSMRRPVDDSCDRIEMGI